MGRCKKLRREIVSLSGLIRIIGINAPGLCPRLELADLPVGIFGIILSDISLQPGRIEDGHGSLITIDFLQDRLSQVNKGIEEQLRSSVNSCLNRVIFEASGTRANTQNSRRSFEYSRNVMSSVSVWIEKIFWSMRTQSREVRGYSQGLPVEV